MNGRLQILRAIFCFIGLHFLPLFYFKNWRYFSSNTSRHFHMLLIKSILVVLQWAPSISISIFWVLRIHILETSHFVQISGEEGMEKKWLEDYFFIVYRKILLDPRVFWSQSKISLYHYHECYTSMYSIPSPCSVFLNGR